MIKVTNKPLKVLFTYSKGCLNSMENNILEFDQNGFKLKTLNYLKTLNFPLSGFPDKNISDSIKYFLMAARTRM